MILVGLNRWRETAFFGGGANISKALLGQEKLLGCFSISHNAFKSWFWRNNNIPKKKDRNDKIWSSYCK